MCLRAFHCGRLARAELAVDLDHCFFRVLAWVLLDGRADALIVTKVFKDFPVASQSQRADKHRNGNLAVFIDADIENVVHVVFILQPRAPVRDNCGAVELFARLVIFHLVVNARGTDQL